MSYPLLEDRLCEKCGKQLLNNENLCIDCKKNNHKYDKNIALYPYEGSVKESLYRFKYGGRRKYAKFFAKMMYYKIVQSKDFEDINLIVSVPISKERLKIRGYNQADEIAKSLSKISQIPYNGDILIRNKDTMPQSGFKPGQRKENIKNAFLSTSNLKKETVLLVDDIYTTGSTLDECAKALKETGAAKVYAIVICIGK